MCIKENRKEALLLLHLRVPPLLPSSIFSWPLCYKHHFADNLSSQRDYTSPCAHIQFYFLLLLPFFFSFLSFFLRVLPLVPRAFGGPAERAERRERFIIRGSSIGIRAAPVEKSLFFLLFCQEVKKKESWGKIECVMRSLSLSARNPFCSYRKAKEFPQVRGR